MKVKELINTLQGLDQDKEICFYEETMVPATSTVIRRTFNVDIAEKDFLGGTIYSLYKGKQNENLEKLNTDDDKGLIKYRLTALLNSPNIGSILYDAEYTSVLESILNKIGFKLETATKDLVRFADEFSLVKVEIKYLNTTEDGVVNTDMRLLYPDTVEADHAEAKN